MDDKETKRIKQIIIRSLENGATKARACAGANIGRATLYKCESGDGSLLHAKSNYYHFSRTLRIYVMSIWHLLK